MSTRGARKVLQDYLREHDLLIDPYYHEGTTGLLYRLRNSEHLSMVRELVRVADGPRRDRFEAALQVVLDRHDDPTARAILVEMVRQGSRKAAASDVLSGDEARWRAEYLTARGWVNQRGTWKPPGNAPQSRHKWPSHASLGNGAQHGDEQECELCGRVRFVTAALRYRYARDREEFDNAPSHWEGRPRAGVCPGRRK